VVENAENQVIEIFDIEGRRIETIEGDAYTELNVEKCGMYVVKVGQTQQKVVVK
ncbi:MAG: T9SS type A sorting domain-containing protein, partial [Bacteroidales bacterium]|nr:T9SS type A sorting domain-containing protein [Bacteroidales bacterium]